MKPVAIGLAVVFFILAALYATGTLQFGAHEVGGRAHVPHLKHAVLFAILGGLSLVWLRFAGNASTGASAR